MGFLLAEVIRSNLDYCNFRNKKQEPFCEWFKHVCEIKGNTSSYSHKI